MKNYSFVILDDENQHTQSGGWKRVFDLFLIPKNYVKKKSTDITLSDNSTFIKNAEPLEVQFFKPENDSYSAVYEKISNVKFQEKKDIYFIDMNWNNADSIKGTNVEEKNLEEITFSDITKGKIPSVLAGLNLLNILPKNDKPKIVFSGSDKTENIRKVFKLLSNRVLTDDILIGEMTGGGTNNYIDEVERKVDTYLQSRQIAIINRQTAGKIQELNKIVKAWNGSIDYAEEPLIPDNGTDTNPEICWSLRTLFPKQVNRIELGADAEESKKIIYEVLNELNFRKLYQWFVGLHIVIPGKDKVQKKNDDECKKIINQRKSLLWVFESSPYFTISNLKPTGPYPNTFSDLISDVSHEQLVEECAGDANIRTRIGHNFSETIKINYSLSESPVYFSHGGLIKALALYFGVYIGDVYYLYACIWGNNKHNFSSKEKIPEGYSPKLSIDFNSGDPQELTLTIKVDSDSDYFKQIETNNPITTKETNIQSRLKKYPFDIVLEEEAMEDYVNLFCNRYEATIEIQFGKKRLCVYPDKTTKVIDVENDKTEYVLKIKAIKYDGNNN